MHVLAHEIFVLKQVAAKRFVARQNVALVPPLRVAIIGIR
jgi:hypothetical protein